MNICKQCESLITSKYGIKFCSRPCSVKYNNRVYPKRSVQGSCAVCKSSIRSKLKYCASCKAAGARKRKYLTEESRREARRISQNKAVRHQHQKSKEKSIVYMGNACRVCGYAGCRGSLVFHHVDPSTKEFTVGSGNRGWDRTKKELNKCVLLCANCHGEVHYGSLDISDLSPGPLSGPDGE